MDDSRQMAENLDLNVGREVTRIRSHSLFLDAWKKQARKETRYYEIAYNDLILFVEMALSDRGMPLEFELNRNYVRVLRKTALAQRFFFQVRIFVEIVQMLPEQFEYHEYVTLFRSCAERLGLLDEDYEWSDLWNDYRISSAHHDADACAETFNKLVDMLRDEGKRTGARVLFHKRQSRAKENLVEYSLYKNALFASCARLVVLRIDLGYRKDIAASITPKSAKLDLQHFHANKRNNALFRDMKGYIIKMEYGLEKGIHFHALLFFDASKRNGRKHIGIAKMIGEYWTNAITKGRGRYWNCNARINDFIRMDRCGIGIIHRKNTELRANLLNYVIKYLVKSDQFVRARFGEKFKRLHKGKTPRVRSSKNIMQKEKINDHQD